LFGNQAQPGRKLATILKARLVSNCRDQGCGRDRTNPFDLPDALTHLVCSEKVPDPAIVGRDAFIQSGQFLVNVRRQFVDQIAKTAIPPLHDLRQRPAKSRDVTANDNAMFRQQAAYLIDKPGRIRSAGPGSMVGVASFFRQGNVGTLAVGIADSKGNAHVLTDVAFERMKSEDPELALKFQTYALEYVSDRLASNLRTLSLVLRLEE